MIRLHTRSKHSQQGFTLVEVVVVSLLLAIMAGILYGTLTGIMNAKSSIEQQRDSLRTARSVLLKLMREFNGAINFNLVESSDKKTSLQTTNKSFMGLDVRAGDNDLDSVSFVTTSGAQAVFGGISNYGNIQVTYRLEEDYDNVYSTSNINNINTYILVREELPAGIKDDRIQKQRTIVFPIAADIVSFNLRYLKNKEWQNHWGTEESGLPEAVEITLKIATKRSYETFRTAIVLKKA